MDSRRPVATTYHQLERDEDKFRNYLLTEFDKSHIAESSKSPSHVKHAISNVKTAIKSYEISSRALSAWLSRHGSVTSASECRNIRLQLVHTDCAEAIRNLNSILIEMGEDALSSIGAPSVIGEAPTEENPVDSVTPKALPTENIVLQLNNVSLSQEAGVNLQQTVQHIAQLASVEVELENIVGERISNPDIIENLSDRNLPSVSRDAEFPPERMHDFIDQAPIHTSQGGDDLQNDSSEILDPISRRQLRQDLLRGYGDPFNGEPQLYWCWKQRISRRLLEAEASALDSLDILVANTTGRPKKMLSEYISAGSHAPQDTLLRAWKSLTKRFGNNAVVSNTLFEKLEKFPSIRSFQSISNMEDLHDMCRVIHSSMNHCSDLKSLDLPRGMKMVWEKFPEAFQNRWRKQCYNHEKKTGAIPSFKDLIDFMEEYIDEVSSPMFSSQPRASTWQSGSSVRPVKSYNTRVEAHCSYHDSYGHAVEECKAFRRLKYYDKKHFAMKNKLCFACLRDHIISKCPRDITCGICQGKHIDALHWTRQNDEEGAAMYRKQPMRAVDATSNCLEVCQSKYDLKICSKTVPVEIRMNNCNQIIKCLAIIDEQSNSTFCDKKIVDQFKINAPIQSYTLSTMAGLKTTMQGLVVSGLEVKGIREKKWIKLPTTITHPGIPQSTRDVASPEIVAAHKHIKNLAINFPKIDHNLEVLLLIGANCGEAMRTETFGSKFPFVHRTSLGWALVGPVCNSRTSNESITCLRTSTLSCEHFDSRNIFEKGAVEMNRNRMYPDIFIETPEDSVRGLSKEEQQFLDKISNNIHVNNDGKLEMPLPLKEDSKLPDNRTSVLMRSINTLKGLKRNCGKLAKATEAMGTYIAKGHVQEVPADEKDCKDTTFYIPVFPIMHPRKNKLRIVFDSSASYHGRSLNDVLLQGPDEGNRIVGVLTRFRHGKIGFSGDLETMFHSFSLSPEHRNLTRFFWWRNNNPDDIIIEYRSNVHNFGNKSSPAIANFGLRFTTNSKEAKKYPNAVDMIKYNFYVDDCLGSADTVEEAISNLQGAVNILNEYSIRLHKFVSNKVEVMSAFPQSECAIDCDNVDLRDTELQKTLGISWSVATDELVVKCEFPDRPLTKRGILSTIHTPFDPLGLVTPVFLAGKLIQRMIIPSRANANSPLVELDWDDAIPDDVAHTWIVWLSSLKESEEIRIPRSFQPCHFGNILVRELHVFCDASDEAIGFIIYIRLVDDNDNVNVSFVFANSKVSPKAATSIPRMELCAALEGAQSSLYIKNELMIPLEKIEYYSDSRVVLGYINNNVRRFTRYITGRVNAILTVSEPKQWNYVPTKENTADLATRPQTPKELKKSRWLIGPEFLWEVNLVPKQIQEFPDLPETIEERKCLSVKQTSPSLSEKICSQTNNLSRAVLIFTAVQKSARFWLRKVNRNLSNVVADNRRLHFMIKMSQEEHFPDVLSKLLKGEPLSNSHALSKLCLYIEDDLIRVGGRLHHSRMDHGFKHPILLPTSGAISRLILTHQHEKVYHQGRIITHASLRQAGYHIHKGSSVIRTLLKNCITCKKLRGALLHQQMANLPPDRLEELPPFSSTGMDTFGPYLIQDARSTRRNHCDKKIWVLLLTCLNSRAVHLEPLTTLDATSLDLALRRFSAIRGNCTRFRSDNGTNFLPVRNRMLQHNSQLTRDLIPPAASHQAGVWERKVGSVKKVLSAAIKQLGPRRLSREEFSTLIQEAASIVNHTPLYEATFDPNDPEPIYPSMLLDMRDGNTNASTDKMLNSSDVLHYGQARWRRVQYLAEQFWVRWRLNFINKLTERHKWQKKTPCICEGDLVLLREPCPRNNWPMARVHSVESGRDGLVRNITLRMGRKNE